MFDLPFYTSNSNKFSKESLWRLVNHTRYSVLLSLFKICEEIINVITCKSAGIVWFLLLQGLLLASYGSVTNGVRNPTHTGRFIKD